MNKYPVLVASVLMLFSVFAMHSGDVLKIRFDDFAPDQLSEPKVTRFSARVCDKELLEDYYRLKAELEKE